MYEGQGQGNKGSTGGGEGIMCPDLVMIFKWCM